MKTNRYDEIFQKNVVVTIDALKQATGKLRESILRDLKGIGYYSSYNERGKYYTLACTPGFDEFGLWKYKGAYFSVRRTILGTTEHLINISDAGRTHDELRGILGIGIQNSLHHLTEIEKITRMQIGAQYVYFGKEYINSQLERRKDMPVGPVVRRAVKNPVVKRHPDIDPTIVIEVLVAALRGHEGVYEAHSYIHQAGLPITEQQVEAVFRHYDIGKKNSAARK